MTELKEQSILKAPNLSTVVIGYYEPGHGSKGKKWLMDTEDVRDMLKMYTKRYYCGVVTLRLKIVKLLKGSGSQTLRMKVRLKSLKADPDLLMPMRKR